LKLMRRCPPLFAPLATCARTGCLISVETFVASAAMIVKALTTRRFLEARIAADLSSVPVALGSARSLASRARGRLAIIGRASRRSRQQCAIVLRMVMH
jgi:hypothetical protein